MRKHAKQLILTTLITCILVGQVDARRGRNPNVGQVDTKWMANPNQRTGTKESRDQVRLEEVYSFTLDTRLSDVYKELKTQMNLAYNEVIDILLVGGKTIRLSEHYMNKSISDGDDKRTLRGMGLTSTQLPIVRSKLKLKEIYIEELKADPKKPNLIRGQIPIPTFKEEISAQSKRLYNHIMVAIYRKYPKQIYVVNFSANGQPIENFKDFLENLENNPTGKIDFTIDNSKAVSIDIIQSEVNYLLVFQLSKFLATSIKNHEALAQQLDNIVLANTGSFWRQCQLTSPEGKQYASKNATTGNIIPSPLYLKEPISDKIKYTYTVVQSMPDFPETTYKAYLIKQPIKVEKLISELKGE